MATTEKDIIKEYPKTKDFADLIVGLGNKLKVDPIYLARTMNAETGGTFSPSKRNTAGSGATGLIQFTKETARNLGTTTQALSKMSAREQMSFVERYFSSIGAGNLARLRNGSQHDVNMAIFYPRAIGKGFDFNIVEDIRKTQSRSAANRFMKQNKGIKKAGDYTMKLTPPLPKLKPSENKRALKIIEKSQEQKLSPEEEKFIRDVKKQDPKTFMDFLKNLFTRDAGASERADDKPNLTAQQMEELFSEEGLDPDTDKQTPTSAIRQLSFKLPSKKDSDKIVDDMDLPPERSLSATIQRSQRKLIEKNPELEASFSDPKKAIINRRPKGFGDDLEIGTGDAINRFDVNREALRERRSQLPIPTDVKSPAGAKLLPNVASVNQELAESPEKDSISYALTDTFDKDTPIEDANELGYGSTLRRLDRNLEPRERSETGNMFADDPMDVGGEADPRNEDDDVIGDFTFIKDLFRGGFDTDDDTDDDTDFFADEPMPMGGEADPKEDVANFEEGGEVKADFDGKKDEDEDEGDPPPLAKPEEVADDIPALLSEGEYVLPANVVRYIGLERIMDMHRQVLAEIQQMEDLGMIQNVDKNGEPEDDDDEMKFAEGEEPEEGVTKGTIIIASAKPKGMMCPEPLMMTNGGDVGAGDHSGSTDQDPGKDDPMGGMGEPGGPAPGSDSGTYGGLGPTGQAPAPGELGFDRGQKDKDKDSFGFDRDAGFAGMPDTEKAALGLDETATELDVAFEKSKKGLVERGLYGLGKLGERMGIDVTEKAAAGREAAEKDASQPGDMDLEIKEENIKQDKVDDVISDLITKNVYIEGVGYVPLASLMSPRDDVTV